jgi:hypothetical protein
MENLKCPQCGNPLANGVAVCGSCGREVKDDEIALPSEEQEKEPGKKKLYAMLVVLLVLLGGAALLIFTGLLPNPMKGGGSTAAIVNGEKITVAEVDQKFDLYKKMSGKSGQPDSTPEGKAAAADMRMQILNAMVQEKILVTEAAKEKIIVPPQEIADKIGAVKKSLNLSDKDFDAFLQKQGMSLASFEKRIEKNLLISKLVAKGTQEKGLTKDVWFAEMQKRAKVEILLVQ